MKLDDLTLQEASSAIRSGALSPLQYVHALLSRIERLEPEVQAWVTLDAERAIQEAKACDAEAKAGKFRGPLHGVPLGIKDIFQTEGIRTTAGSKFLQDFVPSKDAFAVRQLKKAGAIILGKTVTTEFATYDPGPTRNPVNHGHTPGGSSSGSAAAVGAHMIPAATGSQTVGSIGRPAAYCGVVGFMPTQARVSRAGVFPVSWSLDHIGGFGRSVADARLLLEALSGETFASTTTLDPVRIGVFRGFFSAKATSETRDLHEALLKKLDGGMFRMEEAHLPPIFEIHSAILGTIMRTEIASAHNEFYHKHSTLYGAKLRALVETGMLVDAQSYLRALRLRKVYQKEMLRLFRQFDVLVSPGAMDTAPEGLHYTGDPGFTGPWSLADFPTLTLPSGKASNGLPVALQICGPPMAEALLFQVGHRLEDAIRGLTLFG